MSSEKEELIKTFISQQEGRSADLPHKRALDVSEWANNVELSDRERYMMITSRLAARINTLAHEQRTSWKTPERAARITNLIALRHALKEWARACHEGDPEMNRTRARVLTRIAKRSAVLAKRRDTQEKAHQHLSTRQSALGAEHDRLEVKMRDLRAEIRRLNADSAKLSEKRKACADELSEMSSLSIMYRRPLA